ncbi:MAG: SpaA isopeptide-forming pilin-related protein, partial [Micrococcales bacterium]|nr:SpaA isopeptide-forming pilin-related protein [Micrococcales bacterium]
MTDDPTAPGADVAPYGTVTYTLPDGFTYVSSTGNGGGSTDDGTYDPATRTVTWHALTINALYGAMVWVTMTLPDTPGDYTTTATAQHTPMGKSQMTCSTDITIPVVSNELTGISGTKMTTGEYKAGSAYACCNTYAWSAAEGRAPEGRPSTFTLLINQGVATLQGVQLVDPIPCLAGTGDGLSETTPYASLPPTSPGDATASPPVPPDPLCASPAFHVDSVLLNSQPLDNQVVTVWYSDGTVDQIPAYSTYPATWTVPDGKMVSLVEWTGDYNVNDTQTSKNIILNGLPVAAMATDGVTYLMNTETLSAANAPGVSTYSAGLKVGPLFTELLNYPLADTYAWSSGWWGEQIVNPFYPGGGAPSGAIVPVGQAGAVNDDPALDNQRRYAVVIPANSGITVTNVTGVVLAPPDAFPGWWLGAPMDVPATQINDYDGSGDTEYLIDGTSGVTMSGQGMRIYYGGMLPGVYQYYTYSGFTDTDPSESGTCEANGGVLVTDTTGIIAPVGTPRVLCRAINTIVVTSPSGGLVISKTVANVTESENPEPWPHVSDAVSGDVVDFTVQIANTLPSDLTNGVVYDVLPHVGDTGIIDSQVGYTRGSTQTPALSNVIPPAGWTIEYSSSYNPCRPEVGVSTDCDDVTWSTDPTDPIASIRLSTDTVAAGSFATMTLEYVTPQEPWNSGDVAWNSVGGDAMINGVWLPSAEAPKVGFRYPSGTISWSKTDTAGRLLAGAVFEVTGPNGFDQTVTDNQAPDSDPTKGKFLLNVGIEPGDYTITEVTAPDGYQLNTTPLVVQVDKAGDAIDAGSVVDKPIITAVTVYVQKLGLATTGADVPMDGSTWQVLADDSGAAGAVVDGATVSPALDADGDPITGLWQVDGLVPGVYWLSETSAPAGFSLLPAAVQFTVGDDGSVVLGANAGTGDNALVTAAAATETDQLPWWIVTVNDVPAVTLPTTGGVGNTPWLVSGALLIVGAAC